MSAPHGPILDMTPEGGFRPMRRETFSWPTRIGIGAVAVAMVAGLVGLAALAIWLAAVLLPIAALAGVIAWAAFRIQRWRARPAGARTAPTRR